MARPGEGRGRQQGGPGVGTELGLVERMKRRPAWWEREGLEGKRWIEGQGWWGLHQRVGHVELILNALGIHREF